MPLQLHSNPLPQHPPAAVAAASLSTFFRIAARWGLSTPEQQALLNLPKATFYKWRKQPPASLPGDTLERLSYVLGIHKALGIVIPVADRAKAWLRTGNSSPVFNGQSPLDRMTAGRVVDLYSVRAYLDAARGW